MLLAAYNLRNSPVVLPIPEEDEAESSSPSLDNTPVIVMPSLIHEPIIGVSGKSPADYLSDTKWLALIKANIKENSTFIWQKYRLPQRKEQMRLDLYSRGDWRSIY